MAATAAYPQAMCKFSGRLTEAAEPTRHTTKAAVETMRPVWDDLLRWFGPGRLWHGNAQAFYGLGEHR